MVDDLPADFVPRPTEFEPLVQAILGAGSTVGITTALKGAGGFGKTTLARAVCHDPRGRQKFTDGVLWATLGEKPGEVDLIQQMRDMMTRLTGQTPPELGLQALKTLWSEILGDKACLIVIDDAWRVGDLDPFMQGGPKAARLITTRSATILPSRTIARPVDAMTTSEAVQVTANFNQTAIVNAQSNIVQANATGTVISYESQTLNLMNGAQRMLTTDRGLAMNLALLAVEATRRTCKSLCLHRVAIK